MTILIAARFDAQEWAQWWPALRDALPHETLIRDRHAASAADLADVDVAIVANPPAGSLQGLPRLRLVQSLWAGVDRLLADPQLPPGVPLARMVDPQMSRAMAESVLWAVLGLHRHADTYARQQAGRAWGAQPQRRADEITVLVLGLGSMGRACARALASQGYAVHGWAQRPASAEGVACHAGAQALPAALAAADIVVNLLPLTPATTDLLCARTFAWMKQGACLVNFGRGAHLVETDLLTALDDGRLRHAVLDVFREEPLPATHAFWGHPHITVWPHAAAATDPRSAAPLAAANVRALRAGLPLQHLVDRARGY